MTLLEKVTTITILGRVGFNSASDPNPPTSIAPELRPSRLVDFIGQALYHLFIAHMSMRIIPAIYLKPFVKVQKNDHKDAEAIRRSGVATQLA